MKKMLGAVLLAVFALVTPVLAGEGSKEFAFLWDVLDALKYCRAAVDFRVTVKIPPKEMIADTEEANLNLERAKHPLDKYSKETDPAITKCAVDLINAIDILVYSNDVLIAKLESVGGLHPYGFENVQAETSRFRSQSKKGWEEFFTSLTADLPPLIKGPLKDLNSGKAPYKISEEERQRLATRIEELFKADVAQEALPEEGEGEGVKQDIRTRFLEATDTVKQLLGE